MSYVVDVGMGETWMRRQDLELSAARRRRRHTELDGLYREAATLGRRIREGLAAGPDVRADLARLLARIDDLEADR